MADKMLGIFAEILGNIRGSAKIIKAAIEDDLFIQIQHFRRILSDRANIMRKLELRSQADLIRYAIRHDLISEDRL